LVIYVFPIGGLGRKPSPPYAVDVAIICELLKEAAGSQNVWTIVHSVPSLETIGDSKQALVIWRKST